MDMAMMAFFMTKTPGGLVVIAGKAHPSLCVFFYHSAWAKQENYFLLRQAVTISSRINQNSFNGLGHLAGFYALSQRASGRGGTRE
jgi:hypothetical protein